MNIIVRLYTHWPHRPFAPFLRGGPLYNFYSFHSIVFRWGSTHEFRSEHTIDNINYPLEMQLIHVNDKFETLDDAIMSNDKDGIAIGTLLFQVSS